MCIRDSLGAAERPQQHAGADQGAGLVDVHVFQFGQGQFPPDRRQIDRLAADHAAGTCGLPQQA